MKKYICFDANGKIIGDALYPDYQQVDEYHIESPVLESELYYVKDKKILQRPRQMTQMEGNMLKNLPNPCVIYINNKSYKCSDEEAEIRFDNKTIYNIVVEAFPYQDWRIIYDNRAS